MFSAVDKRWVLHPPSDPALVRGLVHDRCPKPIAQLLVQRGITDPATAGSFFRPDLAHLHDPFMMADMEKAVERVEQALGDGERIMVFGDYDVDGTTAVSLVYSYLSALTEHVQYYVPDRYAEGYGLSIQGIDRAKEDGVRLLITLDCGIKAVDKVRYANELGIDVIICDHHRPGDLLPPAVAVLDPKRDDCAYPYKELSGCGIGFKLMQALALRNAMPQEALLELLDLVAVSIACDIVPVTGENRVLAHFGLERLNKKPRPGFQVIMNMAKVKRAMSVTDLVFMVGPRINAAGRIEHGTQAVELLLAKDEKQASSVGLRIDKNNSHRQDLDREITDHALDMVMTDADSADAWSTVLFSPEWHKGVIGIVASRLIEHFHRPTIILTESNGKATGSARSVKGFDVYEAIHACSDLLDQFGGHMYAAGLTLPLDNVPEFKRRFEKVVRETMPVALRTPEIQIDMEVPLAQIDDRFLHILEHMAPFGPQNMRPMFLTRGVIDNGNARIVGEDHLKLAVHDPMDPGNTIDAIAFRQADHFDLIKRREPFSIVYTVEMNEWNGRRAIQLNIKDIKAGVEGVLDSEVLERDAATT